MSRPKNIISILPQPQEQTNRAPKSQKDPKNKSNPKVRIQGIKENESCLTIQVDPKTVYELKPSPKIARNCPKRFKMTKKKLTNKKTEKSYKMKVT